MRTATILLRALLVVATVFLTVTESAQAQFGKNKVQYEEFEWKYVQSKHFDVYYHQGGEYLAQYTAVIAERELKKLEQNFNYRINQRVAIIVYSSHNQFQQTNVISSFLPEGVGGVTELYKNRVVLPYEGKWDQFRHVIGHELVHAFLNDMFYGGSIQSIISNNIRTEIPLWMNEGLAEFESLNGYDVQTDMFMRDITISEFLPSLEGISGYMSYRGGQAFYWYVSEKYGRGKVGDLINRLRSTGTVDAAFRSSFNGMNVEEFSKQWERDMKKIYWPDIAKYEAVEDFSTRITDHEKDNSFYNTSPAISPNGDKMAFISNRDGFFSVYLMDLKNKQDVTEIVSGERSTDFEDLNILTPGISWNPEGTKLAISAKAGGEDALFIVDVGSGEEKKYELGFKALSSAVWSPDGKTIAFVASEFEQPDIYLFDVATAAVSKLTDDIFTDLHPTWSPDSKTIYFSSNRGDNITDRKTRLNFNMWDFNVDQSDIYSIDVATKTMKRITFDPEYVETSITVSSDNSSLLFVSDKSGIGNIYSLQFASGTIIPRTNSLSGITQMSLSRDASKLLFVSQNRGAYDIFELRFPFDRTPTEPIPTQYRQKILDRALLLETAAADTTNASARDSLVGYGDVQLDMSRQKAVQSNPDVPTLASGNTPPQNTVDASATSSDKLVSKDYKISFTPDIILGTAGYDTFFGVQGQTQMLFSDLLGNHQIYFAANLLLSLKNSDFYVSYGYLPKLIDYEFSAFHTARFLQDPLDANVINRYRYYGAGAKAYLPFNTFNRFEFGTTFLATSGEAIDPPSGNATTKFHIVPELRYVHDNTVWGATLAPMGGSRYFMALEGTPKLSEESLGFATLTGDFRHYLPLSDYVSIASRFTAGASFGPNPQNFFIGGTDNWLNADFRNDVLPYASPEDLYFLKAIYPLRGFQINRLSGSRYFLTNVELRFPFLLALFASRNNQFVQGLMTSIFFDMGSAWDGDLIATQMVNNERYPKDLLMSTGVGLRTIFIGYPIRFDVAWRNMYHTFSKPYYMISFGYDY